MHINKSVNSFLTKLVDKRVDTAQVGSVISTFSSFNSFPHNTESDEVHTPINKILDILAIERVLSVEGSSIWKIRIDLINDINTMEDGVSSVGISQSSMSSVNRDGSIGHRRNDGSQSEEGSGL
jgi:hypothetical protein